MKKGNFKRDVKELIHLGVKEVNSEVASAYFLTAIAKMWYYDVFKEEVGDEEDSYEIPKNTDI